MSTIAAAVAEAQLRLRAAGIDTPERDARRLVAFAAGIAPDRLSLAMRDPFEAEAALERALKARERRQPVSQIVGERLFWGRRFEVTPDVLDPRPETEDLIAHALQEPFERVLDLGTGSGCILLTLLVERPSAQGVGTDLSGAALAVARRNAERLGIAATFQKSDWYGAVEGGFDLMVSNPPYIAAAEMTDLAPETRDWEPRMALTDEACGLTAYRSIAAGITAHLVPGGRVLVEIGPTQGEAVAGLFGEAGLENITVHPDFDGRDRVVAARRPTAKS
ncbi:[protein release factor]-glutamine N5-methyltransferase [Aliiruegeria haliotis]|uniref:Release factor glutamine methyltransferase n=1 Tax=Aliiruegeria haliotis TaxID=1280846 RepID=A0A2T0S0A5_9RHOB|nr:peptide chain release factor N(5)-glutamine methyltransferase [Aliiruegeria haliotis]PRY26866.1 [protein release factor]-glutamine N5-methyltransferase [Aliiruegeria haliotis]